MSIVGVEPKKNNFRIVSERLLRHNFYVLQKRILFLKGSMSIVGVEPKKNNFRIVSERLLRHDFYVLQKRILFLKLEKLRIPYDTRFKTLVLLLQPSM